MVNFCGNLIIFELLLWTLVSPISQQQIQTFARGAASIVNKDFGELERNDCANKLQVHN